MLNTQREENQLTREILKLVSRELNPLFKIHQLVITDQLPRTASNKLLRRQLRADYTRKDHRP